MQQPINIPQEVKEKTRKIEPIPTQKSRGFTQGYICACANWMRDNGNHSEIISVLEACFISIADLKKHEVEPEDIKSLMPVIKEIIRKRKS